MRIQPARQRQNYGYKQIWAKQSVRRQQKCLLRAGVDDDDDNIGGMGERKRWVGNNGETMHIAIHPLHDGRIIYVKATEACTRTVRVGGLFGPMVATIRSIFTVPCSRSKPYFGYNVTIWRRHLCHLCDENAKRQI